MNAFTRPASALACALAVTLGYVGTAAAFPALPGAPGDPCTRGPCRVDGVAVRFTIPLPVKHGRVKVALAPVFDPRKPGRVR